ncbi:hypothetical protein AURDEDRAFT_168872 [Auricularia subglabra TFB-10046 SS5]|nr:hypothetical protein AURDEDRAFT_168872 [Auricularia subglabra TFB-10046 SS5]
MEASPPSTGRVSADAASDSAEPEIPEMLLKFEDALAAYVREPFVLPRWQPQATWAGGPSWTEADIARMSSMYLPETPFGDDKPDMLLYELGNLEVLDASFPARLDDFVSGEDHLLLVECSGAGKTRLIFETLCHRWGLYFTCSSNSISSPYGSDDIRMAIYHLAALEINQMLHPLNPRSRILRRKLHENQTKTRAMMAAVLRSRLLVFHLFYKHALACNLPPDVARKKWLVLQLRPQYVFGRTDVFASLIYDVDNCSYETLARDIRRLQRSSAAVLEFIALDEAQVAGTSYEYAFASPDRGSYRPLLSQLVLDFSFLCPTQRLIISGVEGSHAMMQEAIKASGSTSRVRQFLGLGTFGTLERVSEYLDHFQRSDAVDCRVVFHWMGGRHRVLAVFAAYCLLAGWDRWRSVLATMLYKLTGFFELGDPLINKISLSSLVSDDLLDDTEVAWHLRHSLYLHAMHSQRVVTLDHCASDIVTLALGRYGPDTSSVLIDEQLVFLSLYNWLRMSRAHSFHALVMTAANGSLRWLQHTGFLEDLSLVLWHAHAKKVDMTHILQFAGPAPAWVNTHFQLLLTQLSSRTCSDPAERYRPSQLIASARSPEDVLAWFNGTPSPFLLPDAGCGVDMICVVRLDADHRLLVCFETEKQVLSSLRPRNRVTPTHRDMFYAQVRARLQKKVARVIF